MYRRPLGSPKRTRWTRFHPDVSGTNSQMVSLYSGVMYAKFVSPEGYEYEIRPLTKSEQEHINSILANKMLGAI